jgi:hypothetical protein
MVGHVGGEARSQVADFGRGVPMTAVYMAVHNQSAAHA